MWPWRWMLALGASRNDAATLPSQRFLATLRDGGGRGRRKVAEPMRHSHGRVCNVNARPPTPPGAPHLWRAPQLSGAATPLLGGVRLAAAVVLGVATNAALVLLLARATPEKTPPATPPERPLAATPIDAVAPPPPPLAPLEEPREEMAAPEQQAPEPSAPSRPAPAWSAPPLPSAISAPRLAFGAPRGREGGLGALPWSQGTKTFGGGTPSPIPPAAPGAAAPAPGLQHVYDEHEVDTPPRPLRSIAPVYPRAAEEQGVEGSVTLRILVGERGEVRQVQVLGSTPPGVFDEAARSAVQRWRFEPARHQGAPVSTWARKRVDFAL
jgi:protein TonB